MTRLFERFTLVEVIIPASVTGNLLQTKFNFEAELFSGKKDIVYVQGVEVYSADSVVSSPLTAGMPVATAADIINGLVSLSAQNDVSIDKLPLSKLSDIFVPLGATPYSEGPWAIKNFDTIDWTKCFITTITAPVVVPFSYLFGFYYSYSPIEY